MSSMSVANSGDTFAISDFTILVYTWVVSGVLCQIMNIFGIVTNVINIMCFIKQGFRESVNISLLGLAVADLGSLITMVGVAVCFTPAVLFADLPFEPMDVAYITAGITHLSFTRVSGCITAMVTLERCLCITAPLKVKSIITTRRTAFIIITVFILFFFTSAPVYDVSSLAMVYSPLRNKTLIGLVFTDNKDVVNMFNFAFNSFAIPFVSFIIIIVCASTLSFHLRKQNKWRKKNVNSSKGERLSSKSQKTAKMVVMISILFISCYVPISLLMLAAGFIPALSVQGNYINLTLLIAGISFIMESVNSSMNIFIYYHMSTKFRECCMTLLSIGVWIKRL